MDILNEFRYTIYMVKFLIVIVFGFVVPWMVGINLFRKDKKIIMLIAPFMSVLAFIVNVIGFELGFWRLHPVFETVSFTALPVDIGLYPVMGCFMIFIIRKAYYHRFIIILTTALITTICEYVGVVTGFVTYAHGWNIIYTFVSYYIPYNISYLYYLQLQKLGILTYPLN